jgi:ribonuclease P protein component
VLPAWRRIRRAEDFRVVMRAGSRSASRTVVVHAHDAGTDAPGRAGFVVGRSVGGSVVRHRVTRRLRHLMAVHLEVLPAGTDIVVRALPAAAAASADELAGDVSSCMRRALSRLGQDAGTVTVVSQ